jgi:hypothetical protein
MTAVTDSGSGHDDFLGLVVGRTEEDAIKRAKKKWSWFGSDDPLDLYYAGHPVTTISWEWV